MIPIFEPLFSDGSFGYRPGRSAKDAILKVKEYAEQGYSHAVSLDLSKYFDTLNHTILVNLVRKEIKDERVIQMVKRYLRIRGWMNYYGIASMKNSIDGLNGWLYRRIRMCIWKQWKLPRTRKRKLVGLGVVEHYAATIAYCRKGYWFLSGNKAVNWALSKE